jgi:SAM-dependent methyltransferase
MEAAGLQYIQVPFGGPETLTDDVFGRVRELLRDTRSPTLLHCGSANRVGAVWLAHRVLDQGVPIEDAVADAKRVGLRNAEFEKLAREYIRRVQEGQPSEQSVRPGINDNFLRADLDVDEWIGRFEIESREVFSARNAVIKATQVQPGWRVADVGAGTGFFSRLFAAAVGDEGWVYAVDIAPQFLIHINQKSQEDGVTNLTGVLGSDRSVHLPPASVDLVFICDAYHHFEYPHSTMTSIHAALKEGGTLALVDFERIPGQSTEFIMSHVRAGKHEFRGEIEAVGFEFLEEVEIPGFRENYFLRFRKK